MFDIFGEAKATLIGRILKVTRRGAAPGAKSDVCDCVVSERDVVEPPGRTTPRRGPRQSDVTVVVDG